MGTAQNHPAPDVLVLLRQTVRLGSPSLNLKESGRHMAISVDGVKLRFCASILADSAIPVKL
jgi:hypothetical protein